MLGIFGRLFKVGESNVHNVINKMEDPIKMTEQGIRDLKKQLEEAVNALAGVKALALRSERDLGDAKKLSADYVKKATLLLEKGKDGEIDMAEAENLATESLKKSEDSGNKVKTMEKAVADQNASTAKMQLQVDNLKATIKKFENELVTLKARSTTATATKKINEQMAKIDSSGTVAMLERMKNKVEEDEALGEAYGAIAEKPVDTDDAINKALASGSSSSASSKLDELKARMGITETAGTTA